MSYGRDNLPALTWTALHEEHQIACEKKEDAKVEKIENLIWGKKDGLAKLNATLTTFLEKNGKDAPISKNAPAVVYSWGNYFLSFLSVKVTQPFAEKAQQAAQKALAKHKEEENRGLSRASEATLTALLELKTVLNELKAAGIQRGDVMTAIHTAFNDYVMPLEEKAYEAKMSQKRISLRLT